MPGEAHGRIREALEGRPDWCISRQQSGGVPLPIVSCERCGEAAVSLELMERVAAAVEKEGAEAWARTPVEQLLGTGFRCSSCNGSTFRRETDTLAEEFGAACRFAAVLERRQRVPADLVLEGGDQLPGWLASSMLVSVGTRDMAPYRACFAHGLVVDQGHGIALEELLQRYGAEVLRLWVAASDCRDDVSLTDELLQELSRGYAELRGTLNRVLGSLHGFHPAQDVVPGAELLPEDVRTQERLAEVVARVLQAYEACEFHLALGALQAFFSMDLPGYLDTLEERLFTATAAEPSRRSAQTVLFEVASTLLPLLAPVLSFTAEEAWQQLPGRPAESVFLAALPA
jgi:isoleucyl-tRNA synthetase